MLPVKDSWSVPCAGSLLEIPCPHEWRTVCARHKGLNGDWRHPADGGAGVHGDYLLHHLPLLHLHPARNAAQQRPELPPERRLQHCPEVHFASPVYVHATLPLSI